MFLAIVIDVLLRNLGLQSSAHLFTFTEYALLKTPCFGAPWLVREKGHVFVEIGLNSLSAVWRQRALIAIGITCILVCRSMFARRIPAEPWCRQLLRCGAGVGGWVVGWGVGYLRVR